MSTPMSAGPSSTNSSYFGSLSQNPNSIGDWSGSGGGGAGEWSLYYNLQFWVEQVGGAYTNAKKVVVEGWSRWVEHNVVLKYIYTYAPSITMVFCDQYNFMALPHSYTSFKPVLKPDMYVYV